MWRAAAHAVTHFAFTDLLVDSAHRKPTLDNYEWSDLSSDKQHRVNLVDISTKVLYVGIHGYSDSVVSWKASAYSPEDNEATLQGNDPNAYAEGYTQCSNCKAWIPERTRMLHEGFCQRNNILCPQGCGRVLKKGSEEAEEHWHCSRCGMIGSIKDKKKHDEYHHTPKTCTCGEQTFDSYNELARHRRTDCPERLITCRFCHVCYILSILVVPSFTHVRYSLTIELGASRSTISRSARSVTQPAFT